MNERKPTPGPESLNILRLLVILDLLGRRCQRLSQIREYLQKRRLLVSDRQLQRDLQLLGSHFGITSEYADGDTSCKYWRRRAAATWRGALSPVCPGDAEGGSAPSWPASSESEDIVVGSRKARLPFRVLKLIRILLIVEALPDEDEETWAATPDIVNMLRSQGLDVTVRTIQRDLLFIRDHFLVLSSNDGRRKSVWKRIDGGSWRNSFEPRFPGNDSTDHPAVHYFLYRMPPPARYLH